MALRKALIRAGFLAGTTAAASAGEPYTSPYDGAFRSVCLGLRGSIIDGADTHTATNGIDVRARYTIGFGGSAYVGTRLANGFRLEGELKYFTLENLNQAGVPQAGRPGRAIDQAVDLGLEFDI